ncbi:MAG: hypothetical protein HUK09_01590 [Bacteroidaceae bacterium]|nr:hypothetical protein [Bacteroidaceae bacterium]
MTRLHPNIDWQSLIDRYFEATTSEAEEQLLREFVASPHSQRPEFDALRSDLDEVRAVMGLGVAAVRHQPAAPALPATPAPTTRARHRIGRSWRSIAAIAVLTLAIGGGVLMVGHRSPDCVAYVDGQRITDPILVQRQMELTLREAMSEPTATPTAEGQLRDLFSTISSDSPN